AVNGDCGIGHGNARLAVPRLGYAVLAKLLPGSEPARRRPRRAIAIRPERFLLYAAIGALLWAGGDHAWLSLRGCHRRIDQVSPGCISATRRSRRNPQSASRALEGRATTHVLL